MLRRIRAHRLAAALTLLGLLAVTAIASGAIGGSTAKPSPKPLARAVHDALGAKPVAGITARISFVNRLVSTDALPRGTSSPLLSGASGRAWIAGGGRFRLELQTTNGDSQIISDGRRVAFYDGRANKLYTLTLPHDRHRAQHSKADGVPSLREIERVLTRLARHANISGAVPSNVAGRPAYTVSVSPKHDAGLLGAVSLAWDAAHGTPLRIALTAQGSDQPVLELKATDIAFGAVDPADLRIPSPPGVKRVQVKLPNTGGAERRYAGHRSVSGARAVAARLSFPLRAPGRLVGLPRHGVQLVSEGGGKPRALVLYGRGLGGLAVLESPAGAKATRSGALQGLPRVTVGDATGHELPTALGTLLAWRSGGVSYTLVGSLPASAAEAAARDFAGVK